MKTLLRNWWGLLILWLIAFFLLSRVAFFGSFLDEQENWTGSWLISQGYKIYGDFFTHHAPLPYLMGSIIFPWATEKLFLFRIMMMVIELAVIVLAAKILTLRERLGLGLTLVFISLAAPTFNLHQYVASSIAAWGVFVVALSLLSLKRQTSLNQSLAIIIGTFIAIWSAPATIPALIIANLWYLTYLWLKVDKREQNRFLYLSLIINCLIPLILTRQDFIHDFWWSVFTYNSQYYVPLKLNIHLSPFVSIPEASMDFLRQGTELFINASVILIQTFVHIALYLITHLDQYFKIPSLLGVAWVNFWQQISNLTVSLWLLTIAELIILYRFKGKLVALGFGSILLLLQWQNNEVFHRSPFIMVLLLLLGYLLVVLWVNKDYLVEGFLIITTMTVGWPFMNQYLNYSQAKLPMIEPAIVQLAKTIRSYNLDQEKVIAIKASPIIYLLTNTKPALKTYYLFDWIAAVPVFRSDLEAALKHRQAEFIVVGNDETNSQLPWLIDAQNLINQGYVVIGDHLYQRR
jgi:hypothetical protein